MISLRIKTKSKTGYKIIALLLIALIVRILIFYWQYSGDVKNHLIWADSLLNSGIFGVFSRHFSGFNDANYPPVALFLFASSRLLYQVILSIFSWFNTNIPLFPSMLLPLFASFNMQIAFMKLPAILSDIGIGYIIFKLFNRDKRGLLLSALYLLNPAVIYISAVWGQIESIPIFFLFLSYYLVKQNKYFLSHLVFVLAFLSKQTALWLLPIFLIIWWKEGGWRKIITGLTLQIIVFVIIYLPFALPWNSFSLYLGTLGGSSNYITDQALNLWFFIYGWAHQPDGQLLLGFSVRFWSLLLLFISFTVLCLRYFKKYSLQNAGNYLFLLSLFAFFFQTRVHDRHLAPAIPFLLLATYKDSRKIPLYVLLSAYHLFNLYLALRLPFV